VAREIDQPPALGRGLADLLRPAQLLAFGPVERLGGFVCLRVAGTGARVGLRALGVAPGALAIDLITSRFFALRVHGCPRFPTAFSRGR